MKKKLAQILTILSLMSLLIACQDTKESTKTDEPTTDTQKTPSTELTLENGTAKLNTIIDHITNIYIEAGSKYNLMNTPPSDEIYELMAKDLKQYATKELINTDLKAIAQTFCYSGCDAQYFPTTTNFAINIDLKKEAEDLVIFEYFIPANDLSPSYKQIVSLKYEENNWKLSSFTYTDETIDITKKDAQDILKINDYSDYTLKEQKEIQDIDGMTHEAYVFRHNKNTNEQLAVDIHTGYLFSFSEDDTNIYTSTREQYLDKLVQLENDLAYIDDLYNSLSTVEYHEYEKDRYAQWDNMLNEIYGVLKEQLSTSEMNALRQKQREWIVYRDKEAMKGTEQMEGAWQSLQQTINLGYLTKTRCYELVEGYME